jgi:hypothetical protein
MKPAYLAIVIAVAFLAGCDTDPQPVHTGLTPTNPDHVVLLKVVPNKPYEELGKVKDMEIFYPPGSKATGLAIGESVDVGLKVREKAAALGADAVIVKDQGLIDPIDPSTGSTRIYVEGVAIRWKSGIAASSTPGEPTAGP